MDSTPDEGHIDHMTLIFRYMEESKSVERFMTFMPNHGYKAADMFKVLVDFLEKHNPSIHECQGQSYNNASSMSSTAFKHLYKKKQSGSLVAMYRPFS